MLVLQKISMKEGSKNVCNIAGTIQDAVKKSGNDCVCKVFKLVFIIYCG